MASSDSETTPLPGPAARLEALRRNRGFWYVASGLIFGCLAFWLPGWILKILFGWCALCCLYLGAAYLFSLNGLLFKTTEGRIPRAVKVLLFPFFISSYFYNWQARVRDPSDPFHEIEPGLFLGRRLLNSDRDRLIELGINAVLDVTVEYDALELTVLGEDIRYRNLPIFDHGVPSLATLHETVLWIDEQLEDGRKVVVHCALGRGRSATALLAYLLYKKRDAELSDLLEHMRSIRDTVAPNFRQLRTLARYRRSAFIGGAEPAWLIYNPASGQGDHGPDVERIRSLLSTRFDLSAKPTEAAPHSAERLARKALDAGVHWVIVAGGDGTVSQVAAVLAGTEAVLGIIPMGTANALASCLYGNLALRDNVAEACHLILEGETVEIDTVRVNDRTMVQMAGVGFERSMVEAAEGELKERWGSLGYLLSGFRALREAPDLRVRLVADDESLSFDSQSVVVANLAPFFSVMAQGGGAPRANDGLVDVTYWTPKASASARAGSMLDLLRAGLMDREAGEGVRHLAARRVRLETDPPTSVTVDGEVELSTPVEFEVRPRSLRVRRRPVTEPEQ